jgi:outer membrane lipoprotein-sorting protein
MFDTLAANNDLKLLSDDRVDGIDCYRIEANVKGRPQAGQPAKSVYAFAKDSGMLVQIKNFNDKGEDIGHETYSDVKVNEKIDPQRFVFKAPEGVTVRDRGPAASSGPRPPAGPPKPATTAPATPPAPPTTAPAKP